mmetsp:Transcript_18443/g.52918  ORF Transcript_18443/g.52918 Transcript_18443/m.52918 type:complete len:331 (+) Transcript_18443:663-1655(+)
METSTLKTSPVDALCLAMRGETRPASWKSLALFSSSKGCWLSASNRKMRAVCVNSSRVLVAMASNIMSSTLRTNSSAQVFKMSSVMSVVPARNRFPNTSKNHEISARGMITNMKLRHLWHLVTPLTMWVLPLSSIVVVLWVIGKACTTKKRSAHRRSSTVISTTQNNIARKQMVLPGKAIKPLSMLKLKYSAKSVTNVAIESTIWLLHVRSALVVIVLRSISSKSCPSMSRVSSMFSLRSPKPCALDIECTAMMKSTWTTMLTHNKIQVSMMLKAPRYHCCRGSFQEAQPWCKIMIKAQSQIDVSKTTVASAGKWSNFTAAPEVKASGMW